MNARERLRKLIGLPDDRCLTDVEMEIEYETEIAHNDAYRKWLEITHEAWIAEREAEKKKEEENILSCNQTESVPASELPDPSSLKIEYLNLSNRANTNLDKAGIRMLSDCTEHTKAEIENLIGLRPAAVIEMTLARYGLGFRSDDAVQEQPEPAEMPEETTTDMNEEKEKEKEAEGTDGSSEEITDIPDEAEPEKETAEQQFPEPEPEMTPEPTPADVRECVPVVSANPSDVTADPMAETPSEEPAPNVPAEDTPDTVDEEKAENEEGEKTEPLTTEPLIDSAPDIAVGGYGPNSGYLYVEDYYGEEEEVDISDEPPF